MNLFEVFHIPTPEFLNSQNSIAKPVPSKFKTRLIPGVAWPTWEEPVPVVKIKEAPKNTRARSVTTRAHFYSILKKEPCTIHKLTKLTGLSKTTVYRWIGDDKRIVPIGTTEGDKRKPSTIFAFYDD